MGTPKSPITRRTCGQAPLSHQRPLPQSGRARLLLAHSCPQLPPPSDLRPTHPAREEPAVLELAQEEGDEEGTGHEHQRQQGGVGLAPGLLLPRGPSQAPVIPWCQCGSCPGPRGVVAAVYLVTVYFRAVGDRTAVEGMLLENLERGQRAPSAMARSAGSAARRRQGGRGGPACPRRACLVKKTTQTTIWEHRAPED